jgi:hypothetical protein
MIKIKNLSSLDWLIIYNVVNIPPAGIPQHTQDQVRRLKNLFESIVKPLENEKGDLDFKKVQGADLELSEGDWSELKRCFELAGYPSLLDARNGERVFKKIIAG